MVVFESAMALQVSPKYVPREWMLVEAYERAEEGDYSELRRLEALFKDPYEDHSLELEERSDPVTPTLIHFRFKLQCHLDHFHRWQSTIRLDALFLPPLLLNSTLFPTGFIARRRRNSVAVEASPS